MESKFCISISASTPAECIHQMEGAAMVELRADLGGLTPEQVAEVVATHPNVLFTWHTTPETEPRALEAVRAALESGAKWVDVESHATAEYRCKVIDMAHRAGAGVVISYHDYDSTPSFEQLLDTANNCFSMGADVAKVITTAHTTADGATVMALYDNLPQGSLIAFAMGAAGGFTRRLSLLLGAPWGYVAPEEGGTTAPGQKRAGEMSRLFEKGHKLELTELPTRVTVPSTKSASQRVIVCAMLATGRTTLHNINLCGDTLAAFGIAEALGCKVTASGKDIYTIDSAGPQSIAERLSSEPTRLCVGESGLLTRLLLPLVATLGSELHPTIVEGVGTLLGRDMSECVEALRAMGAEVKATSQSHLPLCVVAHKPSIDIVIDGSRSSQSASGLMVALPLLPQGTTLTIEHPTRVPYLLLTEHIVARFGHKLLRTDLPHGGIRYQAATHGSYTATAIRLESDWSSAGYFAAAYALAQSGASSGRWVRESGYVLEGMSRHSAQADEVVIDILQACGCNIVESPHTGEIVFFPSPTLRAMDVDGTQYPDLIPTLAVVALFAQGTSRIGGLHRLTAKESNRTEAIYTELRTQGAHIHIEGDSFIIEGMGGGKYTLHAPLAGAPLLSYGDHRMVMSLAVASLFVEEQLHIDALGAEAKSFPTFFDYFNKDRQI